MGTRERPKLICRFSFTQQRWGHAISSLTPSSHWQAKFTSTDGLAAPFELLIECSQACVILSSAGRIPDALGQHTADLQACISQCLCIVSPNHALFV